MTDIELTTDATIPTNTSVDVTIYEDTDGDGTAENTVTQSINDGTNTYTLSGFDYVSGNEMWTKIELDTTDKTKTPSINSISILPIISGTISGVSGATIYVIDKTSGSIAGQTTTNSSGNYSVSVSSGSYHVIAQASDGSDLYNAKSYSHVEVN